MYPILLFLFIFPFIESSFGFTSFSSKLGQPIGNSRKKPPTQPTKPPGRCLPVEFQKLRSCYDSYLSLYGMTFVNGTLPHKSSKPFDIILDQQTTVCKNYQPFLSCESDVAPHCITFESLQNLAGDESDALYYLQNLAYIELYCDHSKDFIRYSHCLELIDANELEELVYEECELNIADNCTAVQKTVKCERGVISMVCDDKGSMSAYCTYQNLQMRRAAWNYCVDMPCGSNFLKFPSILLIFLYKFL